MDKMYNNLMDIVNRTKSIDGGKKVVRKVEKVVEKPESDAPIDEAVHTVRKSSGEKKSLFAENSAISKLLTKKAAPKKTTKAEEEKPAKKTTKSDTKKTAKKTESKSTQTTKKPAAEKKTPAKKTESKTTKPEIKKEPAKKIEKVEKEAPKLDLNDPKNVELYNALRSSLFSEGTDISAYMEEPKKEELEDSRNILRELQSKKEEVRQNQEISREQQEYEALFNGTLGEVVSEEPKEDDEEIARLQEFLRPKIQKEETPIRETNVGKIDDELESKIAEYYKRKNEKIAEFMKSELDEEPEEESREVYEDRQREYEDIFSGGITSRSSLFGEEETPAEDDVELEETQEEVQENEDVIENFDDNMVTSFEYMEQQNSEDRAVEVADNILPVESDLEEFMKPKELVLQPDQIAAEEIEDEESEDESFRFIKEKEYTPTDREIIEDFHNNRVEDDYTKYDDEELDRYSNYASSEEGEEYSDDYDDEIEENDEQFDDVDEESSQETVEYTEDDHDDNVLEVTEEESDLIFVNKNKQDDDEDAYENELSKYIIADNMPTEKKGEHYDEENNTIVVDGDNLNSLNGMMVNDVVEDETEEDESLSKEEFYNEMARLQENLINELKGNKIEEGVDLFNKEEVEKAKEEVKVEPEEIVEEPKELTEEEKAENLVNEIIYSIVREERLQNIVEGVVEENHKYDDYNLLGKDAPLGEDDLEYIRQNKEKEKELKDKYFYLSAEDNEKKQEIEDAYLDMYNAEVSGNIREMGDINLNKDIYNAVPFVEEYAEENTNIEEDDNVSEEEMEAIYTLFGIEKKKVVKMEKEMKVLYVASECQPFIATGGLADVAGSVTKVLAKNGVDCRVIMPLYGQIKEKYQDKLEYLGNFTVHLSWRQEYCGLFRIYQDGVTFYFIDNERYFNREKTYGYYDDGERFAYFSKAIVESLPVINFFPDIIHCNDWQSALVSVYIKTGNWSDHRYYKIKHVYTIHNIEYQGVYGMENLKDLFGIDLRFQKDLEYNGDINLSKAAILYSDKFTTVSDSYCDNLKEPYCSRGLHHIIIRNEHKLSGIVNGVDYDFYHPSIDKVLYKNYDINSIDDKVVNKKLWQDELGLPVDGETPMLAIVSRLVSLKGLGLVTKIAEEVLQNDVQLVVVGTGDQNYVDYFKHLEQKYPTKVRALCDKYSNELARKAYGASDIFLMPSKVEPCGISQMISSLYGSVPIVRETGGLKDTIKDFGCENGGNGYTFNSYNHNDLLFQINRAIRDYGDKAGWRRKVETCMSVDFSWDKSVKKYLDLYKSIVD